MWSITSERNAVETTLVESATLNRAPGSSPRMESNESAGAAVTNDHVSVEWILPPETLEMIFKRLPARELVRCSSVSTVWRRTISEVRGLSRSVALERAWRFGIVEPRVCYKHQGCLECAAESDAIVALVGERGVEVVDLKSETAVLKCPIRLVGKARSVCFYKQSLIVGNEEGYVSVCDAKDSPSVSEVQIVQLKASEGPVFTLVGFEGFVAVGERNGQIGILSLRDRACKVRLSGHRGRVTCIAHEEKENLLVSGSWDKTIRVWNATDLACTLVLNGHRASVESLAVTGDTVVSGACDFAARLWSLRSGECLLILPHRSNVLALSSSESHIFSGSYPKVVKVWDRWGLCLRTLRLNGSYVRNGIWGEEGKLVCVAANGEIIEWDFSNTLD
ncbi:hypothetical protein BSKO_12483 [Bryopsis sp. KO-2023]|nr:hypothetical protein BSKO_12483 [Bryopsis sp. KO-2023]